MIPNLLTFEHAEDDLNNQDDTAVVAALSGWHPTVLAELLKAVAKARYIRYQSSRPDWTEAVREVAEKAGLEVPN